MERRDFLVGGAVGAGSLLWPLGARAEGIGYDGDNITAADMRRVLEKLDGHSARSRGKQHLPLLVPELVRAAPSMSAAEREDVGRGEQLYQESIRSLLLVGTMRALPLRGQLHPGMQQRLWDGHAEMASSVTGMRSMLEELPAAERIDVARALRDKPDLAMRTIGLIDEQAASVGLPMKRRAQMREMARHITWRMRTQSATAIIDEYSEAVRRIEERPVTLEALQRRMVARMGQRKFDELQQQVRIAHASWQGLPEDDVPGNSGGTPSQPGIVVTGSQPYPTEPPRRGLPRQEYDGEAPPEFVPPDPPGTKTLRAAYILFGISAGLGVAGSILLFGLGSLGAAIIGMFLYTPAALLLLAGLIVLIVGLVQRYG